MVLLLAPWTFEPTGPGLSELQVYVQIGASSIQLISLHWQPGYDTERAIKPQLSIHPTEPVPPGIVSIVGSIMHMRSDRLWARLPPVDSLGAPLVPRSRHNTSVQ